VSRIQPTFRVALSVLIVALVALAVLAVGASSRYFGRKNATALSTQVLDQTLQRIDLRIQSFLRVAVRQGQLSRNLLETGQLSAASSPQGRAPGSDDFARISAHFGQALRVHAGLTNLGIGIEATGEFCMAGRKPEGLTVVTYIRGDDEAMRVNLYALKPEGREHLREKPFDGYDPRKRPFYRAVVDADAAAWTDAYLFFGAGGGGRVPGVTYGTPVRDASGSLAGVVHADFALQALCEFLAGLREEVSGVAFVVEVGADGSRRAIAHPEPSALLHSATDAEGKSVITLAKTLDQMGDPRARTFIEKLPASLGQGKGAPREAVLLEVEHEGETFYGAYRPLGGRDAPGWVTCMMIPRSSIMASVEENERTALWIALVSFLLATLLSVFIASSFSRPLRRIAAEYANIGRFQLGGPSLGRSSITELDRLMTATDEMKVSLQSFERYVPARLVHEMAASGAVAELGGESRTLTVYFSHILGFSELQAQSSAEDLVEHLGAHFTAVTDVIEASGGTLDKYIGDAVMSFWGAPHALEDHALRACRAALLARDRTVQHACAGINTGELVVGNMGSQSRLNYTVLGDAVNLAARLEGLNKIYGTTILIGESTYRIVSSQVVARKVDRVAVKGRSQGVEIHELLAMRDEASPDVLSLVAAYESALEAYFERRWADAEARLDALRTAHGEDGPARVLLERVRAYRENPPPEGWGGVYVMTSK
jgi:adenylate cyclase